MRGKTAESGNGRGFFLFTRFAGTNLREFAVEAPKKQPDYVAGSAIGSSPRRLLTILFTIECGLGKIGDD